jgi:hypothetical protein
MKRFNVLRNLFLFFLLSLLVFSLQLDSNEKKPIENKMTEITTGTLRELVPTKPLSSTYNDTLDFTDDDFNQARISVAIGYELISELDIYVGVERVNESSSSEIKQSRTGLPSNVDEKITLLQEKEIHHPNVTFEKWLLTTSKGACNISVFSAELKNIGFCKEDIHITTEECHWFLTIKDNNVPPSLNQTQEINRSVGWIESFNITIGSMRFSSLTHPVFAAGWEVTTTIKGLPCEIFHKTNNLQENDITTNIIGGGASISEYHWHWERGTKLYGVAGVIGVAFFDSLGDRPQKRNESQKILEFLENTGIWEIYYMITNNESDDIDDSDMIYLLDDLVNDAIGSPASVDHCFWYITSHGGEVSGVAYIASSNTWNILPNNKVTESELANIIDDITDRGVWLFFWMDHCKGDKFADWFWEAPSYHNNHTLFWCYTTAYQYSWEYEIPEFKDHINFGQKSCQWMFDGPGDYHTYENVNGDTDESVFWIEYVFENEFEFDMQQHDTMNGYEFCIVPNSGNWIPTCRTRGEPSTEMNEPAKWDNTIDPYRLYAYETSPGYN